MRRVVVAEHLNHDSVIIPKITKEEEQLVTPRLIRQCSHGG